MGMNLFLNCHIPDNCQKLFNGRVVQNESLDTGPDELKDLLFGLAGGDELVCTSVLGAGPQGWVPTLSSAGTS